MLPANSEGVIAVVSNTCNQTFSYLVDGDSVTYLGPEDLHDKKYDGRLELEQLVVVSFNTQASPKNRAYTAVDMNRGFCDYTLAVYPSQELEDRFLTNRSTHYTVLVASIFFFTSLVFVIYDLLVARRQRIVTRKAIDSGAIVSSLFPVNVQSRLFDEQNAIDDPIVNASGMFTETDSKDAIADLFPQCSVLFADVAGFTGWRYALNFKTMYTKVGSNLCTPKAPDENQKMFSNSWKLCSELSTH